MKKQELNDIKSLLIFGRELIVQHNDVAPGRDFKIRKRIIDYCQSLDLIFEYHKTNQWHFTKLSDDINSSGQVKYFFENDFLINNDAQLKSLSIIKIQPFNQYPLLFQLPFLKNLVLLQIEFICRNNMSYFNLPQLKKLIFSSCINISCLKIIINNWSL
ncbi:unnamed protein product [Adineta steineri]|uniref:Uncharacterized protein n=1 Tax=Adineta steineri TaxID=433720 RepID=A0A819UV81_9BILA|nr:unnamed protein product [Adineta steineri]